MVQSEGQIYRLRSDVLREEFGRGGALQKLLLRFTNALLTQISQAAVCNRRHSIDQQLCRWLLLSLDRLESEELTMTHEVLANTLGVRREGITEAARKLHNVGLINYRRGRITVIDRIGVEAYCCECYSVVRGEYDRLPGPYAHSLHGAARRSQRRLPMALTVPVAGHLSRRSGGQQPLFRLVARNIGRDVGDVVGAQSELLRVLDGARDDALDLRFEIGFRFARIALELMAGGARAREDFLAGRAVGRMGGNGGREPAESGSRNNDSNWFHGL